MNPTAIIESILFVASKPLGIKQLAKAADLELEVVEAALVDLKQTYTERESGITIAESEGRVQLVSHPDCAQYVAAFREKDLSGELTKAQLETLTVIAYQQPITRPELEDIRGVNSSVIIRTLLLRGLIRESLEGESVLPQYMLTIDALRELGVSEVTELPGYESFHAHPHITEVEESTEADYEGTV